MTRRPAADGGLDRRLLLGGAAGAAAATLLRGAAPASASRPAPGTSAASAPSIPEFELAELSITDLQAGLVAGRWDSLRLVELYLERIAAVEVEGRSTRAVAEVNPDAVDVAVERDRERKAGKLRGPLHGIPIVLKDNIDTADRMRTTAGSLALAESVAPRDAAVVERLRAAGAVLLAKTNLSEWANFRSPRSSSGWSGRGGQVSNPYALDRNPCGSSSGSGVAASAAFAAAAVGTETDGSVTCPASMNGVAGLKPTLGLVSRRGIVPIAHSQDTAGPMGRTVADVAILLGAMAGEDRDDVATSAGRGRLEKDWRRLFGERALAGARLGVARNYFGWHAEIDRQMEEVLRLLGRLGAELVDPAEIPHKGEAADAELEVMLYEFRHDLNLYLAALPPRGQPRTLAELIDFNRRHAREEMPWFGQELFERAEAKGPLSEEAYVVALATCRRLTRAEGLDALLGEEKLGEKKLDALVCPTMGPAYLTDLVNGDAFGGSATAPPAVAGYPHLTVPAGFVHGLPWGLSFIGPAWSDAKLLAYGDAFERASRARRAPAFLSSVPAAS